MHPVAGPAHPPPLMDAGPGGRSQALGRLGIRAVAALPEALGGLAILSVTLVLFAGVIWRYFLGRPLIWTDEVARILFIWLGFLGAAIGVKRRAHMAVEVLGSRLPPPWRRRVRVFALLNILLTAGVLVVIGASETRQAFAQVWPTTGLSRGWVYLSIPVCGLLMLTYLVPQLGTALRGAPPGGEMAHAPAAQ